MNFKKLSAVMLSVIFSSSFYSVAMIEHPHPWVNEESTNANNTDDCSICICPLSNGEPISSFPEGCHWFHQICLGEWLKSHIDCPYCKREIECKGENAKYKSKGLGYVMPCCNTNLCVACLIGYDYLKTYWQNEDIGWGSCPKCGKRISAYWASELWYKYHQLYCGKNAVYKGLKEGY